MKILYLLFCIIILSSCGTNEAVTLPIDTDAEFTDGVITVRGRLFFDGEKMSFLTDKGYKVTITSDGGEIEYDGIVFCKNVIPSSRFLPLYELLCSEDKLNSTMKKGNLKITFLKETK